VSNDLGLEVEESVFAHSFVNAVKQNLSLEEDEENEVMIVKLLYNLGVRLDISFYVIYC